MTCYVDIYNVNQLNIMKNRDSLFLSGILLFVMLSTANTHAREVKSINANWSFSSGVAVPRGLGWGDSQGESGETCLILGIVLILWHMVAIVGDMDLIELSLISNEYKGKRLFIKFEGAGTIATVFVNSNFIGEHKRVLIPLLPMRLQIL